MLWYKGWLETRWRLVFVLAMMTYSVAMARWGPLNSMKPRMLVETVLFFWILAPIMLAGAGMKTQAPFRIQKGLHGSTLYTLTLPVSRLRLVLVRAAVGYLEMTGLFLLASVAVFLLAPALEAHATLTDALENTLVMTVCGAVAYVISVLLSTFLDDLWQAWGSILAVVALTLIPLPSPFNLFRAMGAGSPLVTHTIPWASLGVAAFMSLLLFWVAVRIAEAREF